MQDVVVRYAPSPTGIPHIGNIRTALFNFLFSKNRKGKFILRIEDTDRKRFVSESIEAIEKSLRVLGFNWDEVYRQSERLSVYQRDLKLLKDKGLVYQDEGAWRFKVKSQSQSAKLKWDDGVHGPVEFASSVVEDFVIVKSDGFPTYHFASVVDDHDLKISHVLRGDEWISSTPKHLLLYEAFEWNHPEFIHVPPILGPDKKKLSKREGAKSVLEYIEDGYLPEALVNFLALLGWSPKGDKELFTLDELIAEFSVERLNKNSPIFNLEKLNWFNRKYLAKYAVKDLSSQVRKFSKKAESIDDERLTMILNLIRDRMTTLADFGKYSGIFFEKGKQNAPIKEKAKQAKEAVQKIVKWDEKTIEESLEQFIKENNLNPADFKNTLRLSVFADNTPPIYQSLAVMEKAEVLSRIDDAIKKSE